MNTSYGFSRELEDALQKSSLSLQRVFRKIVEVVRPYCGASHAIKAPNYRFYNSVQFCGMTPQSRKDCIRVGVTNDEARITSDVFEMERCSGEEAKWSQFSVDPHDPIQVIEAVRIILAVSRSVI